MIALYVIIALLLLGLAASVRIVKQYERGVRLPEPRERGGRPPLRTAGPRAHQRRPGSHVIGMAAERTLRRW